REAPAVPLDVRCHGSDGASPSNGASPTKHEMIHLACSIAHGCSIHNNGNRTGRFLSTSSFGESDGSDFHVCNHSSRPYANPPNNNTAERTGHCSQNITSGLCGHAFLSLM